MSRKFRHEYVFSCTKYDLFSRDLELVAPTVSFSPFYVKVIANHLILPRWLNATNQTQKYGGENLEVEMKMWDYND